MTKNRKPRKESKNTERDMAIARMKAPIELGGRAMTNKQIGQELGLSTQRVQQIINEPDVKEAHKSWLHGMFKSQRASGAAVQRAFEELVEEKDARVVIDYFRRMGVDVGPGIDVNIAKLELTLPPGVSDLLKLNPLYEEPDDAPINDRPGERDEAESSAATGSGE